LEPQKTARFKRKGNRWYPLMRDGKFLEENVGPEILLQTFSENID
jgi:hypothetical protein